jgi:hypothetical protein
MNRPILPRAPVRRRFPSFRFLVGPHWAMDPPTAGQSVFRSHHSPIANSSHARGFRIAHAAFARPFCGVNPAVS